MIYEKPFFVKEKAELFLFLPDDFSVADGGHAAAVYLPAVEYVSNLLHRRKNVRIALDNLNSCLVTVSDLYEIVGNSKSGVNLDILEGIQMCTYR